jgi:hypothetical protein
MMQNDGDLVMFHAFKSQAFLAPAFKTKTVQRAGRLVLPLLAMATMAASPNQAAAQLKEFTFSERANDRMAKKLNMPVYFALPASARSPAPGKVNTSDVLIDFKHPDAKGADIGLRIISTKRGDLSERLGRSGLVQTGDLLLTFRSEWGGAGAYPNIQMGVSHTGIAYVKDGQLHNLDNPLNAEYLGASMRGDFSGEHYKTLSFIHVIRPRNLTAAQRTNIATWSERLNASAKRIYPEQLSFNQDYNAPKYQAGKPYDFVKSLGQIALGQKPANTLSLFCSEFAWSLLALRDCDPGNGSAFSGDKTPACISEPMKPMDATGDYIFKRSSNAYVGLADGPLLVIDALKLPPAARKTMLQSVFAENPSRLAKLSPGHKTLAESMSPKFIPLQQYYTGAGVGFYDSMKARLIRSAVNRDVPDNYSPTSFLVNTLLPPGNVNRTMDYVATIVFE